MTSKGHIYKIICNLDSSFCYIGSTFNRLHKRFLKHKIDYKHQYGNFSLHEYFDKYGIDNFKIMLIKSYQVIRQHNKDHKHLSAYESLWICKTKNCCNKVLPFNPLRKLEYKEYRKEHDKKYREQNKNYIKEYKKKYREQNKTKINQKFTCPCGGRFTHCHKSQHLKTKLHKKYLESI
jgi:hypothetical protein